MTNIHRKNTDANIDPRGNADIKRIMPEKKTTLPSLRNQDWKTVKSETEKVNDNDKYPDKRHHLFNICRSKISLWKNRGPPGDHRQKIKTRVGTQTRIKDKNTTTTSKNTKTEHILGQN